MNSRYPLNDIFCSTMSTHNFFLPPFIKLFWWFLLAFHSFLHYWHLTAGKRTSHQYKLLPISDKYLLVELTPQTCFYQHSKRKIHFTPSNHCALCFNILISKLVCITKECLIYWKWICIFSATKIYQMRPIFLCTSVALPVGQFFKK